MITVDEQISERDKILLDERPIVSVHFILLRIINTGNLHILESDFVRPLIAEIREDIINVVVSAASPEVLKEYVKWERLHDSQITFDNILLNVKGDLFEIQMLASGINADTKDPVTVKGRIAGVTNIRRANYPNPTPDSKIVRTSVLIINFLVIINFLALMLYMASQLLGSP